MGKGFEVFFFPRERCDGGEGDYDVDYEDRKGRNWPNITKAKYFQNPKKDRVSNLIQTNEEIQSLYLLSVRDNEMGDNNYIHRCDENKSTAM